MNQDEFLVDMARRLEEASVPFMIVGSHGSSFHSQPRTTQDVDFVVDPTAEQLDAFLTSFDDRYYVNSATAREALANRSMFNVIVVEFGWKADMIVRKDRPFSVEEFQRRQWHSWHGRPVPIATAEDVILAKLEWSRITESERQVADAVAVAAVQKDRLDHSYLRLWANELDIVDRLERVLAAIKVF